MSSQSYSSSSSLNKDKDLHQDDGRVKKKVKLFDKNIQYNKWPPVETTKKDVATQDIVEQTSESQENSMAIKEWKERIQRRQLHQQIFWHNLSFEQSRYELGYTNAVLVSTNEAKYTDLYLPGYLRMKIKDMSEIILAVQEVHFNAHIEFSLYYGNLPFQLVDYIKDKFTMRIGPRLYVLLREENEILEYSIQFQVNRDMKLLQFKISTLVTFKFEPYHIFAKSKVDTSIWFSPFEIIPTIMSVAVEDLTVNFSDVVDHYRNSEAKQQILQEFRQKIGRKSKSKTDQLCFHVNLMDFKNLDHPSYDREEEEKYRHIANRFWMIAHNDYHSTNQKQNKANKMRSLVQMYKYRRQMKREYHLYNSAKKFSVVRPNVSSLYEIMLSRVRCRYSCEKLKHFKENLIREKQISSFTERDIRYQSTQKILDQKIQQIERESKINKESSIPLSRIERLENQFKKKFYEERKKDKIPLNCHVNIRSRRKKLYLTGSNHNVFEDINEQTLEGKSGEQQSIYIKNTVSMKEKPKYGDTAESEWVISSLDNGHYAIRNVGSGCWLDGRQNKGGTVLISEPSREPEYDYFLQWDIYPCQGRTGMFFKSVSSQAFLDSHEEQKVKVNSKPTEDPNQYLFQILPTEGYNRSLARVNTLPSGYEQREPLIKEITATVKKMNDEVKHFKYAYFEVTIFKCPGVPLSIVFLPLFIISFINLAIFFAPQNLNDRLANLATLLIAYVAFFPIFRSQVPSYSYLLLAEILTYLQIVCSGLALLNSVRQVSQGDFRLPFEQQGVDFYICMVIIALTFTMVIGGYLVFRICLLRKWRRRTLKQNLIKKAEEDLDTIPKDALLHFTWNNYECDLNFFMRQYIRPLDQLLSTSSKPRSMKTSTKKKQRVPQNTFYSWTRNII